MSDGFALSENARTQANMIRIGTVVDLDTVTAKVTVRVAGVVTDWLPWITQRAGTTRTWNPPRAGEQVLILAPYGDLSQSVVLPSLYQTAYPSPVGATKFQDTTIYPDGSVVSYDSQTNALAITIAGNGNVTINCKTATITALTKVELITPTVHVTGDILADGDVKAGAISLKTHKHGGVQSGGSQTGLPV